MDVCLQLPGASPEAPEQDPATASSCTSAESGCLRYLWLSKELRDSDNVDVEGAKALQLLGQPPEGDWLPKATLPPAEGTARRGGNGKEAGTPVAGSGAPDGLTVEPHKDPLLSA